MPKFDERKYVMLQQHKQIQMKANPWESDDKIRYSHAVWYTSIFVALIFFLVQPISAQNKSQIDNTENITIELTNSKNQLSRSELRLAEDYQEIISKLEFYIRHHLGSFLSYNNFEGRKYQNLLLKAMINLEKGTYFGDANKLTRDLEKLTLSLKEEEQKLKNKKELKKLCKNVRILRNDIEDFTEILVTNIGKQLSNKNPSLQKIKIFLQNEREEQKQKEDFQIKMFMLHEQLEEGVLQFVNIQESLKIVLGKEQLQQVFETETLQKELEQIIEIVLELDIENNKININVPEPPIPPLHPIFPKRLNNTVENNKFPLRYILSHQYQDSILVKSNRTPINIENQIGNIVVKGWDRKKIVVTYSYEVTADTHEETKSFLEAISLETYTDKSGIHIATEFPKLHNTNRQVTNSQMVLYVPQKNVVNITNSFGLTDISNFKSDITITTNNSDINVENIKGSVSSYNKNGNSFFSSIDGGLDIVSDHGKVFVKEIHSKLNIQNSYAPIFVSDCQGEASLINSGEIAISNHTGNLNIQNNNGKTTVQSLNGNLTLTGSFKPFFISSINGSVKIENQNAVIHLTDVFGKSIVTNRNGQIKAQNLNGPIDFSNFGGEIFFVTNKSLTGNSVIKSDYGIINIVLPKESNILLNASTEGGSILNSYNTKINKENFLISTTVALGNKKNQLRVSGTNSTIIIKDMQ